MKKIKLTNSTDQYSCETCGGSYAESWLLECEGKMFGSIARAHCFEDEQHELSDVLRAFMESEGYTFEYEEQHLGEEYEHN